MTDEQDISVTSVDFSHENHYIVKPPNYKGHIDIDEDNFYETDAVRFGHHGSMNGENEDDTAKQDEDDGGGEEWKTRKVRASSPQNVENNVFRQDVEDDLAGKELPGDHVKGVGSRKVSSGHSKRDGGARGKEERALVNDVDHGGTGDGVNDVKKKPSQRGDSWVMLNKDGKVITSLRHGFHACADYENMKWPETYISSME